MKTTCLESGSTAPSLPLTDEPLAVLAARVACALERSIQHLVQASDQNLGHLEVLAAHDF